MYSKVEIKTLFMCFTFYHHHMDSMFYMWDNTYCWLNMHKSKVFMPPTHLIVCSDTYIQTWSCAILPLRNSLFSCSKVSILWTMVLSMSPSLGFFYKHAHVGIYMYTVSVIHPYIYMYMYVHCIHDVCSTGINNFQNFHSMHTKLHRVYVRKIFVRDHMYMNKYTHLHVCTM